jgi:hypothetical protein
MRDDAAWALVAPEFTFGLECGLALSLLRPLYVLFFDILGLCLEAQPSRIGWPLLLVDGNAWDLLRAISVAVEVRSVVGSAGAIGIHSVGWS